MSTIVEPLPVDLTAAQVFERLAGWPYLLFLDSASQGTALGRYSFVTADPFEVLRTAAGTTQVLPPADGTGKAKRGRGGEGDWSITALHSDSPFSILANRLQPFAEATLPGLPPFQGGAAGLLSYDLCHYVERLPRPLHDEFRVPDLAAGLYDWVAAFDHEKNEAWLISTGFPEVRPEQRRSRATERLKQVQGILKTDRRVRLAETDFGTRAAVARSLTAAQYPVAGLAQLTSNFSRAGYLDVVRRAIEYIYAGDIFQVNLSQRLLYPLSAPPVSIYQHLRQRNPAPFAGYFDLGEFVILSASPERFLQVQGEQVETRPIKGTRHRGMNPEADLFSRDALQGSEKDRAENVMIVDLLRNDLSRVCRPGTVVVPQLCEVETFQYVQHLVSVVRGRLKAGLGPVDALRAAFPGGSVTGAPKVRACEIIAELEPTARGPYCGCLAYIGFDGAMDTSILIRTMTAGGGWLQLPAGGGIVAQSVPEQEYEETLDKAEGMVRALAE